jgi:hypothetical protein
MNYRGNHVIINQGSSKKAGLTYRNSAKTIYGKHGPFQIFFFNFYNFHINPDNEATEDTNVIMATISCS